ncbi:hypothetical protein LEN26_005278 [Aphanomyces euteiches]|nr:hypothetical protein LEN26_005278 [Aphanomyces euteiches]
MKTKREIFTVTSLTKENEELIANWARTLRQDGIPVSRLLLAAKALDVAATAGLTPQQFKASSQWIKEFMTRWGLSMRAKGRSGTNSESDGDAALERFSSDINDLILEHNIAEIYNADETAVNYEIVPTTTIDTKGVKHVWIRSTGHEKDRMTAMLLADTKGTKYPLFLVLKTAESRIEAVVVENLQKRHGFGVKVWSEIEELQERHPSQIYGNPSAWWNSSISVAFLQYHFGYRKDKSLPKILLLWDDFSANFTAEAKYRQRLPGSVNPLTLRGCAR